jgi:TetR/AcrR family transcriptional regulator, transcriptional repressor for nem operon
MTTIETRDFVLNVAQEFVQTRGFNAFSFRDVAERVGIKTASIHYYFPTKAELCRALIARQREQVRAALAEIDLEETDPKRKLARYVSVFRNTLELGNRMCLCGMLAADFATLDPSIVEDLRRSFEDQEAWLTQVLDAGMTSGALTLLGSPRVEARLLASSLEGAMLIARVFEDVSRFEEIARGLLGKLTPGDRS